jgi:hypothetical protein
MALPMVGCPSGTLTVTQHRHEEDAASASENNARSILVSYYGRQDSNIEVFDYDARADVRMRVAFVGFQVFANY